MRITDMAKVMYPDDLERHIARVLSIDEPLGHVEGAWHIIDSDGRPALMICKHIHHDMQDVVRLNTLMARYGIPYGYLVTPGEFDEQTQNAARLNRNIFLIDGEMLDVIGGDT